ncbi:MAG: hypothetical protein ABIK09_17625 [Pseudomonadota bacterium]
MQSPKFVLIILALVVCAACNAGNPDPGIDAGPSEGDTCDDPGATACGITAAGEVAVLLCTASSGTWEANEACPDGCFNGSCAVADTTPEDVTDARGPEDASDVPEPPDSQDVPDVPAPPDTSPDEVCVPQCDGKVCGDDGCDGTCGKCPGGEVCVDEGAACCVKDCVGKHCGDDGCGSGTTCGQCVGDEVCNIFFQCGPPCVPKCAGKECGPDNCGGSCGGCLEGYACGAGGQCSVCVPACGDKVCGDNGCGGICGSCPLGDKCEAGFCVPDCIGYCVNKDCGDNGCGGSCGACGPGQVCTLNGQCAYVCETVCEGKECGPDGCGGQCGKCPDWAVCTAEGLCDASCVPDCTGKTCGDDGCEGSCGDCAVGFVCTPFGICADPVEGCGGVSAQNWCDGNNLLVCDAGILILVIDCLEVGKNAICTWLGGIGMYGCQESGVCVPDCTGKECGGDGCGGSCGQCGLGQTCEPASGVCQGEGACGQISSQGCCSGNTVVYCDGGGLQYINCNSQTDPDKGLCGWNSALGFYDCTSSAGQGPGLPYYCPGGCVPDCFQKQCGDDGCGGSCGGCPPGLVCQGNLCQAEGGGCGPYDGDPVCQQDTVVWCEGGQIVFMDCADLGPYYYCGWNPDLFVHSCVEEVCEPACENKECGDDGCGSVCGYCPVQKMCNDEGQCVYGQGFCGPITYEGECQGNEVAWCQNGILQTFDCAILGPSFSCGWFEQGQYYWCIEP